MTIPLLPEGFYDSLVTKALRQQVEASQLEPTHVEVVDDELAEVVGRYVQQLVRERLAGEPKSTRREVADGLIALLGPEEALLDGDPRRLTALLSDRPGAGFRTHPETPLGEMSLLTNAPGEPSMGAEISGELGSADGVDLLCAFVKWYGLRTLQEPLRQLTARGVPLRVITSTYLGATERRALDRLVEEFGAEVRVSYETQRTRLHAKAWMFTRNTGFDTAYVGSSNLSSSALLDGVEWNVRINSAIAPQLMRKFAATFDSYWEDPAFEPYSPADGERLDRALATASGRGQHGDARQIDMVWLEVSPWPHQQLMLDALAVEREVHDRHRNLLVAATGTGKTIVAALDYRALAGGDRPSLLFVAHREEILRQARGTYRQVLGDGAFGELLGGGQIPTQWTHVFATVQSLNAARLQRFGPSHFDIVVIDEFHHAEAATYRRVLNHLEPKELLGLTATPERGDGIDVRSYFGGRAAYELRLWEALSSDLLCPFHYFGISDNTDLSQIGFERGRYSSAELTGVYTGNDARARLILKSLLDKVNDVGTMRALGFCAGVQHAEFMAEVFNRAGINAMALHGGTPDETRRGAIKRLRGQELQIIFVADLFNEGVDIPDVDVLLFLRPTDSSTVFLQQLGRGLRRTQDKAVLTVLDFVGHHRKEFNLAQRYRAVIGGSQAQLERQVQKGFPYLPAGSQIVLDRVMQDQVLHSIRQQISTRWDRQISELKAIGDVGLGAYLLESGLELADVVSKRSWTALRMEAGMTVRPGGPRQEALLRRVSALAHVDDVDRHAAYSRLLGDEAPHWDDLSKGERRWAAMLFFSLWPKGGGFESLRDGLEALRPEAAFRDEAREVLDLALESAGHVGRHLAGRLASSPLRSHARYSREELLAALEYADLARVPGNFREGVLYSAAHRADAFLITLKKAEKHFSPTTMYRDYAVNSELFHWESQSRTTVGSATGARYVNQRSNGNEVLLFCRETSVSGFGAGAPYTLLGDADYVSHRGEKPIAITWRLRRPMPADLLEVARAVG